MRKALNENPVVQMVLIGVLVVVVGFLFMTRVASQGGSSAEEAPAADPAATSTAPITGTVSPATGSPAAPAAPTAPAPAPGGTLTPGTSEFVAGPGLPEAVVDAYERGETVVLLIVSGDGIDDRKLEAAMRQQAGGGTALFISDARDIAEYSRITQGVDVDRVPALVVIRPKRLSEGPLPEATVSYGYRGPQSVAQAVRDANYAGRSDLPTYPE